MPSSGPAGTFTERPGGDSPAREQVSEIERARILAAMVDVASEAGAGNATIARVVARSGVSRRTFYELFEDREACFLGAFDEAVTQIAAVVSPAYEQPGPWRSKMRFALLALLEFLDRDPATGRLVVVEALAAGPSALDRRRWVLSRAIAAVDRGRADRKGREGPSQLTAEGVVGGVLSLVHARMLSAPEESLLELVNPLMSMIVLPYLGPAAARRELTQPSPAAGTTKKVATHPLRHLEMRLTYRTVRVLLAIGEHPGASNRQIGDASGIRDQGQISKLLARLEHLGLIHNAADAQPQGQPNRWTLTERGGEVRAVISAQSAQP